MDIIYKETKYKNVFLVNKRENKDNIVNKQRNNHSKNMKKVYELCELSNIYDVITKQHFLLQRFSNNEVY